MDRPSLRALTIRLAARSPSLRTALVEVLARSGRSPSLKERLVFVASDNPTLAGPLSNLMAPLGGGGSPLPPPPVTPQINTGPGGNTAVIQQAPIVINQPPIVVQQQAPAVTDSSKSEVSTILVTDRTAKGFEADLLPELKRLVHEGLTPERAGERVRDLVSDAFRNKNQLYNVLIRHQATFETDAAYQEGLERLIQTWVTDTANAGG